MKKLLTVFLLLFLAACDGDFNINDVAGKWQLQTLDGQTLSTDASVTLDIQADGKFSGKAPVNRYFGQINIENGALNTSPVGSTMMAASPELMNAEQAYFKVLNDATSAKIKDGQLVISGTNSGKLVFDKTE
jgi:heat shock protein HslJ